MHSEHDFSDVDLTILRSIVTDAVRKTRDEGHKRDPRLISRLRNYELSAWAIGLDAHTIQVIASGRRLLGDRECLRPKTARPSRDVRPEPPMPTVRVA